MTHRHLDAREIDAALDGFAFPATFDLGVSTSGYQVEGGFNGPEDPKNNWYLAELSGWKERTGPCARFLDLYEADLGRAAAIGLSAFRMGIEWARLQPGVEPVLRGDPPPFSAGEARRYARIMAAAFDRGLFPAVTLFHWTHPFWAGPDLWLDWRRARELFLAFVEFAVRQINRVLVDELHRPAIPYYITMNEPVSLPTANYLGGVFPCEAGKGMGNALTCYENILMAHVLAYRAIHRIHEEEGWPRPTVTLNTIASANYGADKMAQDLLLARANGISRTEVPLYLTDQRARFRNRMRRVPHLLPPRKVRAAFDAFMDRLTWKRMQPGLLARLTDLLYEGDDPRAIDVLGFDIYDAFPGNYLEFGFPRPVRFRTEAYEWHVNPTALGAFLEAYGWTAGDLPIHILEHGMCYRARSVSETWPHPDGITRDAELKLFMLELVRALRAGSKVEALFYWSLLDNYEWGTFEPRFGLFGVDYADGARRLETDIRGTLAAGAYSLFVQAFRSRDLRALREAFTTTRYPVIRPA